MTRDLATLGSCALGVWLLGCAPAAGAAGDLARLGGPPAADAAEAAALEAEAESLFARRTVTAVREAAALWTRAARGRPAAITPLTAATRARVWLADHETTVEARREAARAAVQTARHCERRAPEDPACMYWLAAAMGVQARERRSTALDALARIETLLQVVTSLRPEIDRAGPDRALAFLYARAPGWPTGPGDPGRAVEHGRRAVALRSDHPPNHLALAEALERQGNRAASREAYRTAHRLARQRLAAGEREAADWIADAEAGLARTGGPGTR